MRHEKPGPQKSRHLARTAQRDAAGVTSRPRTSTQRLEVVERVERDDNNEPLAVAEIRNVADRRTVARLCAEIRVHAENKNAAEAEIKACKAQLDPILARINRPVVGDGWQTVRMKGRKTIKAERLLERGVGMEDIEWATVVGKDSWSVRGIKDGGGGDEE